MTQRRQECVTCGFPVLRQGGHASWCNDGVLVLDLHVHKDDLGPLADWQRDLEREAGGKWSRR